MAHAIVLGLHTVCCGLPVAATLIASGAVGLTGLALFKTAANDLHETLHHYELWILAVSVALVAIGGLGEWAARRQGQAQGFPAFFAISAACLALNAGLIVGHREAPVASASTIEAPATFATQTALVTPAPRDAHADHRH